MYYKTMKSKKLIILLSALCINLFALSLESAKNAFESSTQPETDVWTVGDYLFIKVDAQFAEDDIEEERDELLMSNLMDKLYSYVCDEANKVRYSSTPFSFKMSKFILGDIDFKMNNIDCCTVKQIDSKTSKTEIIAYEKKDIESLKDKMLQEAKNIQNVSEKEWTTLLVNSYKRLKTTEERQTFLLMLGTPLGLYFKNGVIQYNQPFDEISEKGWKEFLAMFDWSQIEFYSSDASPIWKLVWMTKGNVRFPKKTLPIDSNFKEAKELYARGIELQKIIALLKTSIESNPDNIDKWRYLGGALKVNQLFREAFVSYMVALRFDPENISLLEEISNLCHKCDMPVNGEGLKWYVNILKETKK